MARRGKVSSEELLSLSLSDRIGEREDAPLSPPILVRGIRFGNRFSPAAIGLRNYIERRRVGELGTARALFLPRPDYNPFRHSLLDLTKRENVTVCEEWARARERKRERERDFFTGS